MESALCDGRTALGAGLESYRDVELPAGDLAPAERDDPRILTFRCSDVPLVGMRRQITDGRPAVDQHRVNGTGYLDDLEVAVGA